MQNTTCFLLPLPPINMKDFSYYFEQFFTNVSEGNGTCSRDLIVVRKQGEQPALPEGQAGAKVTPALAASYWGGTALQGSAGAGRVAILAQAEWGDEPCHLGRAARSKRGQGQGWRLALLLALRARPTAHGSAEMGS